MHTWKYRAHPSTQAGRAPGARPCSRPGVRPTRRVRACRNEVPENEVADLPSEAPTCHGPCQSSAIAPAQAAQPCLQDGRTSGYCQRLRRARWLLLVIFGVGISITGKQSSAECFGAPQILFGNFEVPQSFAIKMTTHLRHFAQHLVKMPSVALSCTLAYRLVDQFVSDVPADLRSQQ